MNFGVDLSIVESIAELVYVLRVSFTLFLVRTAVKLHATTLLQHPTTQSKAR